METGDARDSKEYWIGRADALAEENRNLHWMLQTTLTTRREIPADFQGTYIAGAGLATTTQTAPTQAGIIVDNVVLPISVSVCAGGVLGGALSDVLAPGYVVAMIGALLVAWHLVVRLRTRRRQARMAPQNTTVADVDSASG